MLRSRCYSAGVKRLVYELSLCVLTAAMVACSGAPAGGDLPADADAPSVAVPTTAQAAGESAGMAYPTLYRDLDLPELPGGTLTSTGRQTTSLRDGLVLRITTSMPVAEARDYYSNALRELGWDESPTRGVPGAPMAGLNATKDGLTYTATIMLIGDATQVAINLHDQ